MPALEALRVAVDLLHVPSRVRLVRAQSLPEGMPLLLRVAAGEQDVGLEAGRLLDRPPEVVREAAAFFVEQILLGAGADSYRVLGASPQATSSELRHNMASLIKWLHPDSGRQGPRSVYVNRVTMAWEDLKTPQRRAAYDEKMRASLTALKKRRDRSRHKHARRPNDGILRRALLFLLRDVRR